MSFPQDSILPQGSLILVTGVTGFLASIITDQLLHHGFRVRGTVRDPKNAKASWMPEHFDKRYRSGKFEMVQVEDMEKEGCFDDAAKGCYGMVHVASVVGFEPDPNKIVTPSLIFIENALEAAEKEQSIKRFVFTSSSAAVSQKKINEVYDLTDRMWADWAVEAAWAPPPYTMERAHANYYASKVLTEEKLWSYIEERKPHFVVNSVLPDFVIGLGANLEKQGHVSSMGIFKQMVDGSGTMWRSFSPQWCVDSVDTALLHIAGLLHPHTENERIFAYAHRKTWTDFVQRLDKMYPNHKFPDPIPDEGEDLSNVIGREKAEDLLKWMGKPGWRPLNEMLKEVCDTLV
ncbi:NAD(P)-binding protein [Polychaeton citri CBS 116435]|uniref:NAD(P)-binding protein n=1 Tax=Polychaeton citri CBS 116435 TaxID=1314669 RepID=A0A9P4USZ8_9PEZI|nr:NAD(P)-binding protein [Polychaeton citri CBS 116435]